MVAFIARDLVTRLFGELTEFGSEPTAFRENNPGAAVFRARSPPCRPWPPVRCCVAGMLCVLCCPSLECAQATWQAWAEATVLRVATERLRYAIDAEVLVTLSGY